MLGLGVRARSECSWCMRGLYWPAGAGTSTCVAAPVGGCLRTYRYFTPSYSIQEGFVSSCSQQVSSLAGALATCTCAYPRLPRPARAPSALNALLPVVAHIGTGMRACPLRPAATAVLALLALLAALPRPAAAAAASSHRRALSEYAGICEEYAITGECINRDGMEVQGEYRCGTGSNTVLWSACSIPRLRRQRPGDGYVLPLMSAGVGDKRSTWLDACPATKSRSPCSVLVSLVQIIQRHLQVEPRPRGNWERHHQVRTQGQGMRPQGGSVHCSLCCPGGPEGGAAGGWLQ